MSTLNIRSAFATVPRCPSLDTWISGILSDEVPRSEDSSDHIVEPGLWDLTAGNGLAEKKGLSESGRTKR